MTEASAMTRLSIFAAIAVKMPFEQELLPAYRKRSGEAVDLFWAPTTVLMSAIEGGERSDVIVAIDEALDRLEAAEIIDGATRVPLASAVLGVAVRKGEPHPDISTLEKFRQALLSANGVAYSIGGASGIYFQDLIARLGIKDTIKAVTIPSGFTAEKVADGSAQLAVQQISELASVEGAEIVGHFPEGAQSITNFSAAIFRNAAHVSEAREFLKMVSGPDAHAAYEKTGLVSRLMKPE